MGTWPISILAVWNGSFAGRLGVERVVQHSIFVPAWHRYGGVAQHAEESDEILSFFLPVGLAWLRRAWCPSMCSTYVERFWSRWTVVLVHRRFTDHGFR